MLTLNLLLDSKQGLCLKEDSFLMTLNLPLARRQDKLLRAVTICLLIRFIS